MKTILVLILAISLCITVAWADFTRVDRVPIYDVPQITGKEVHQPSPMVNYESAPPMYPQLDVIGDIDTVGTTWYDYQHNGTAGRMIAVDELGSIHVVWMNGLDNGATQRHVYYNMMDSTGVWVFGNSGVAVESAVRGGYTCLSIDGEGYPYPTFHVVTTATNPDAEAAVARDLFYGAGAFAYWQPPFVPSTPLPLEVIWPKSAIDINGRIHMVNTENPRSGVAGDPQRIYYIGGEYNTSTMVVDWDAAQTEIDWVEIIGGDLAASRTSDRVALAYVDVKYDIIPPHDTTQYNNDIYLVISEDGINWDFNNPINVTSFIDPDSSLFPDTVAADMDTLRAYNDLTVVFDYDDNINLAFTTAAYYAFEGLISVSHSMIFSWNERDEYFGMVADGFWGSGLDCGAWQRFVQRPQLIVDEDRDALYCTWMQYDTGDVAANNWPQADAMVAWSDCEGAHWSEPTNITDTHAPGGEAGHCMHERDITANELVVDDYLQLLYVMDKDAGGIPQDEGAWTLNPVYYHRVPIDEISHDRIGEFSYPMHVDSTGFPPPHTNHVRQVDNEVPVSFQLAQNYPNPFNPTTNIRFDLNGLGHVSLKVYNVLGQEVANLVDGRLEAGTYEVPFDATELASGVYFYKLSSSAQTDTRKMVLLK